MGFGLDTHRTQSLIPPLRDAQQCICERRIRSLGNLEGRIGGVCRMCRGQGTPRHHDYPIDKLR